MYLLLTYPPVPHLTYSIFYVPFLLFTSRSDDIKQALKDVARETIILNNSVCCCSLNSMKNGHGGGANGGEGGRGGGSGSGRENSSEETAEATIKTYDSVSTNTTDPHTILPSSYPHHEGNGNQNHDQSKGMLITALVTEITQALTEATKGRSALDAMTHQFEAIVADDNTFTIRAIPINHETEPPPPPPQQQPSSSSSSSASSSSPSSPSSSPSSNKVDVQQMSLLEATDHGLMASELLEFAAMESLDHAYSGDTPPPPPLSPFKFCRSIQTLSILIVYSVYSHSLTYIYDNSPLLIQPS